MKNHDISSIQGGNVKFLKIRQFAKKKTSLPWRFSRFHFIDNVEVYKVGFPNN